MNQYQIFTYQMGELFVAGIILAALIKLANKSLLFYVGIKILCFALWFAVTPLAFLYVATFIQWTSRPIQASVTVIIGFLFSVPWWLIVLPELKHCLKQLKKGY